MAKVNTLISKGYLFVGVIMAANMFIGNEMKAMETKFTTEYQAMSPEINQPNTYPNHDINNINQEKNKAVPAAQTNIFGSLLFGLLSWEGRINFFVGLFLSGANNYLKLWDYNPGLYCNLRIGCLGLRSKRFLNGMLQFEGNLNLIRGTLWLIPGIFELIQYVNGQNNPRKSTACLIMLKILGKVKGNEIKFGFFYSILFLVQGFVSIPLTLHFSKFSISISLDSLIWGITGFFLEKKEQKPNEGAKEQGNQIIIDEQKANQETDPKKENEDSDKDN